MGCQLLERNEARAKHGAAGGLDPELRPLHPPLLKEALFIGMWGCSGDSILHRNLNSTSLNQTALRLLR